MSGFGWDNGWETPFELGFKTRSHVLCSLNFGFGLELGEPENLCLKFGTELAEGPWRRSTDEYRQTNRGAGPTSSMASD